jgi:AraC-like DNA-binding protein
MASRSSTHVVAVLNVTRRSPAIPRARDAVKTTDPVAYGRTLRGPSVTGVIDPQPESTTPGPVRLQVGTHAMVLSYRPGDTTQRLAHPAWQIVIPWMGVIEWGSTTGHLTHSAGVVFPPQVPHDTRTTTGQLSLFIDPWYLGLGRGNRTVIPLDPATVELLRALFADNSEPDDLAREAVALLRQRGWLPGASRIDHRVTTAVRQLASVNRLEHAATTVGLSSSRFRALLHEQTGTPPAGLRSWQRLRIAIQDLPVKPIALAAVDAGFADQAHLTRTANRLVGQTPGEIMQGLRNAAPERGHHRFDQGHDAMRRSNRRMSAVRQSKDYGVGHAA